MRSKRYLLAVLFCLCIFSFSAVSQTVKKPEAAEKTNPAPTPDDAYHQLVRRIKANDAEVDFQQLRDSFAVWLCNDQMQRNSPTREAMVEAFNNKNYAKAVELVEIVLEDEFVHLGLHRAAEDAYHELGDKAKADFHKQIAEKLLKALMTSGDGQTAKSAYRVLTIKEEYFVMRELGYQVSAQALMSENDKPYDVLMGNDTKTNKSVSIYFDISSFFGGCKKTTEKKQGQ